MNNKMSPDDPFDFADFEFKRLYDKHEMGRYDKAPECLYHYTDAPGLKGILESGKLHCTDLRFMNDAGELQYVRDLVRGVAPGELDGCARLVRNDMEMALSIFGQPDMPIQFHATCFCEAGDVLSQWRAYGSGGGGYAIGFETAKLISIVDLVPGPGKAIRRLDRIDYNPETQKECVRMILAESIAIANRCAAEFEGHPKFATAMERVMSGTVVTLWQELSRMKHELYREEREWRIVQYIFGSTRFRVSRAGLLVPFVECDFRGSEMEAVTELRWGPTIAPELARRSLKTYAQTLGYKNVKIEGSAIPLRF